ncbi:MAG: ArsR family transcriptional regulator [Phenylobacterium sp.]|uniref:ArsR/SmtB family transcription factor n=1 Tax=Phenylobacterium sp. TaxID=1871053 RepID=UPI00120DC9D3|nr:metalloregulator ArsR/SmtB family transcription factor [Phenylobacterium sp.]TAJ70121.1 MAG: ArsR family transcriptional regulator [Phenylobacterium sp.]
MEPWSSLAAEAPAELLRALADPIRRRLLERLVSGPSSAGELARRLGLPRVNISHHLGVLAAAGLVELRQRQAVVQPEALTRLRRYFDMALTAAAITLPGPGQPVAITTHR